MMVYRAAGGYVDNNTENILTEKRYTIFDILENNDAYNALKQCDGLIITGNRYKCERPLYC